MKLLRVRSLFQLGLTVIELMVMLALIGVLAIAALPLYQEYLYRVHVKSALQKTIVLQHLVEHNVKRGLALNAGFKANRYNTRGFSYWIDPQSGQIRVIAGPAYIEGTPLDAAGRVIVIQPSCLQSHTGTYMELGRGKPCIGTIQWRGAAHGSQGIVGDAITPVRSVQGTMPEKYVPAEYR